MCVFFAEQLRCAGVTCPALPVPSCPKGSVLTKSYTPPAGCCPSIPPQCTCDFSACQKPHCPSGQHLVALSQASGQPGDCCDVYECRKGDSTEVYTTLFDCCPTASSSCTVGMKCISELEAIMFLLSQAFLLAEQSSTVKKKKKVADCIITVHHAESAPSRVNDHSSNTVIVLNPHFYGLNGF